MSKSRRISITVLASVVVTSALLVLGWRQIHLSGKFDQVKWQNEHGNYDGNSTRLAMLSDLEQNYLRIGMDRQSVIEMLGEPDSIRDSSTVYYLGGSPYGIDSELLTIEFDANGVLASSRWSRD